MRIFRAIDRLAKYMLPFWILALIGFLSGHTPGGTIVYPDAYSDYDLKTPLIKINSETVEIVALGDSNQLFGGYGWDAAWQKFFERNFNIKATGLLPWLNGSGTNHSMGEGYSISGDSPVFGTEALPSWLLQMCPIPSMWHPLWNSSGTINTTGSGLVLLNKPSGGLFDVGHGFKFHMLIPGEIGTSCGYRPTIREYGTWGEIQSTVVVVPFIDRTSCIITIPLSENAARSPNLEGLEFRLNQYNQPQVFGPFASLYARIEDTTVQTGFGFTSLYALGGASARDCLETLQSITESSLDLWALTLQKTNGPKTARKEMIVFIDFGLNDRNEHQPSLGPHPVADSSTPEGFIDNIQGIIRWFKKPEIDYRYNTHFVIVSSQPISTPDDSVLESYRAQAKLIAQQDKAITAIDVSKVITSEELTQLDAYNSPTDHNHLKPIGYDTIVERILDDWRVIMHETVGCQWDLVPDGRIDTKDLIFALSTLDTDRQVDYTTLLTVMIHYGEICFVEQQPNTVSYPQPGSALGREIQTENY